MINACKRLQEELKNITFNPPSVPVVNNADAIFLNTVDSIKASLVKQLDSPLLWEDSIRNMVDSGIDTFIEVGPGKVLTGLIKRIDSSVKTYYTDQGIDRAIQELADS
ncbi:MAG: hypothetical protein D6710_05445 [Nitrospirae bacterium]|nr:MAG: hypothetical protein D6710_05445 [Nitrospirota bacterium]